MKTEGGLVNEIRGLDGERKALVYDNYSKLIGATEVIRGMSGKIGPEAGEVTGPLAMTSATGSDGWAVDGLEKKIVAIMEGTSGPADTPEGGGFSTRDSIRCVETPRMRRRRVATVRWVMDAPARVEKLVRDGRGLEATREWSDVKQILDQWSGVKGVDEVKRRGEAAFSGG